MTKIDVKDKKITLMGLGVLGRGVNVAKYLLENGANLVITDLKSETSLAESIEQLKPFASRIEYVLERHRLQDFSSADLVVKAAGVPLDSKYLKAAKDADVPIKMDASWLVSLLPRGVKVIGVTGTKGKTTVTHLIKYIIDKAIKAGDISGKVYLAGNIPGLASLPLLDKIKSGDYLLLELDSWQLQGFHDEKFSPHLSVFTNLMPDHLNYYKSMNQYFNDKSAIYKYQSKQDFLVLSASSFDAIWKYGKQRPKSMTAVAKPAIMPSSWEFSQPGEHNRLNAIQAFQTAKFLDVSDEIIKEALETFPGVAGRLELIAEKNGVRYYNDTTATTPEAVCASLKAFGENKNVILITGGVNKGLKYEEAAKIYDAFAKEIIMFPEGVAKEIEKHLKRDFHLADSMSKAVELASELAVEGDVVLMSPGAASFGMFKNEYDRGEQFNGAVNSL